MRQAAGSEPAAAAADHLLCECITMRAAVPLTTRSFCGLWHRDRLKKATLPPRQEVDQVEFT